MAHLQCPKRCEVYLLRVVACKSIAAQHPTHADGHDPPQLPGKPLCPSAHATTPPTQTVPSKARIFLFIDFLLFWEKLEVQLQQAETEKDLWARGSPSNHRWFLHSIKPQILNEGGRLPLRPARLLAGQWIWVKSLALLLG